MFPDDIDPVWSPTGNALAFTRARALFARSVFRVNADGTGLKALLVATKARSYETPDWAPGGSRLAVTMRRLVAAAHPPFVVTMNADGTGQLLITPGGGFDPAWSPDQAKIVNAGPEGLVITDPDGQNEVTVTTSEARVAHDGPDWQPLP